MTSAVTNQNCYHFAQRIAGMEELKEISIACGLQKSQGIISGHSIDYRPNMIRGINWPWDKRWDYIRSNDVGAIALGGEIGNVEIKSMFRSRKILGEEPAYDGVYALKSRDYDMGAIHDLCIQYLIDVKRYETFKKHDQHCIARKVARVSWNILKFTALVPVYLIVAITGIGLFILLPRESDWRVCDKRNYSWDRKCTPVRYTKFTFREIFKTRFGANYSHMMAEIKKVLQKDEIAINAIRQYALKDAKQSEKAIEEIIRTSTLPYQNSPNYSEKIEDLIQKNQKHWSDPAIAQWQKALLN